MTMLQRFLICCLLVVAASRARAEDGPHLGPLFDDSPLTLAPGRRTEAVGPFFYSEEKETQRTWAIPPLFSSLHDPVADYVEMDFIYPVVTYDRFGSEWRWQIFQLFSFAGGEDPATEQPARRFTLFPIYFQQRSPIPDQNYTAVVPIYGHLKNRLLRDEIFFVMFPIYSKTRKKDVVTDNYVYPFFHLRHGDGLRGWQFWPIVGHEHKEVTTRTNIWGDTETIPGHDSRFVLWPFYLNAYSGIGTENPQHIQSLIPFYSFQRSKNRDSTSYGPPAFLWPSVYTYKKEAGPNRRTKTPIPLVNPFNYTHTVDREKKYEEWDAPWPFIVFARGPGKTTSRVWPFFGRAHNDTLESDFYAWPIYKYNRVHSDPLDRHRTRLLLFLYSDIVQKNTETGQAQRRVDFWPLFTHKRDYNGSTRLQLIAPLEPILPNSKSIERDYSPLWSVWRAEKNTKTGASSQSLLWNLYRRDAAPDSKKCSLLFGLFQYESGSAGKRLRLFYIPVVKTKPGRK